LFHTGPIIRITPWEIHINDPSFLDEIYAPASRNREKYAFFMKTLKVPGASGITINHEIHRRRREALNPFFSKKAITAFETVITERVAKLSKMIESYAITNAPVNLSDAYYALANE
jgi:cytochrome P450